MRMKEIEQLVILGTLVLTEGNRVETAEEPGISVRTLRNKLEIYRRKGVKIPPPTHENFRGMAAELDSDPVEVRETPFKKPKKKKVILKPGDEVMIDLSLVKPHMIVSES